MKKILWSIAVGLALVLAAQADPPDQQVVDLFKSTMAATDFSALAPLLSRSSLQEISKMDTRKQKILFGMMKTMAGLDAGPNPWTVEGHRREKSVFFFKLSHQEKNCKVSTEFPVVEEGGQLKADLHERP